MEWARAIAAALVASDVSEVVLSPGSRSTPLAIALAEQVGLRVTVVVDERVAGFVALGQARVAGRPTALVCTSGTALAHYHPAVIEAAEARVPLLVISADRPLELQATAASQTIDQVKIFGDHARRYIDLGVPDPAAQAFVPRMVAAAVLASLTPLAGPVHLNARFRKPLEPAGERAEPAPGKTPRLFLPQLAPADRAVAEVVEQIRAAKSVVVAAGPAWGTRGEAAAVRGARVARAVGAFAEASGAAVLAEPTSGLFGGAGAPRAPLGALGWLLESAPRPDVLIQLGRPPVCPRFGAFASAAGRHVIVDDVGGADPDGSCDAWVVADPALFFAAAAERLERLGGDGAGERRAYRDALRRAHAAIATAVSSELEQGELSEPLLAREVAARLPAGSFLLAGNSTPVRDLCAFGSSALRGVTVLHQRGAAGIDGLVAGLAGARLTAPDGAVVAALIGDVSALHDAGAFVELAKGQGPTVCVVADNAGGRIFEALPVASTPAGQAHLDRLFLTAPPRGLVGGLASAFGVDHRRVTTRADLGQALDAAFASKRPIVVEVVVPAEASRATRARIRSRLAAMDGKDG